MIILDTNVLSGLMQTTLLAQVAAWFARFPEDDVYTTAITEAEVFLGIALLPGGKRRSALLADARVVFERDFLGRVLPFDSAAARLYGTVGSARRLAGRPISDLDAQIAAICLSRRAMLATRNTADFRDCGVDLVDPWKS